MLASPALVSLGLVIAKISLTSWIVDFGGTVSRRTLLDQQQGCTEVGNLSLATEILQMVPRVKLPMEIVEIDDDTNRNVKQKHTF
jgi:hypothetical protein